MSSHTKSSRIISPIEGDLKQPAMRQLINDELLNRLKYEGDLLMLNTMKDLMRIKGYSKLELVWVIRSFNKKKLLEIDKLGNSDSGPDEI